MITRLGLTAAAASLLLVGCGTGDEPDPTASPTPHGYVEGAEEAAEPQRRLVYADGRTVAMLDPATEKTTTLDTVSGITELATDGRFVFVGTGSGATVVDSGVWTVDHGDHRHYYRAEPDTLGSIDTGADLTVLGDAAVTVVNSADGVTVLDRPALDTAAIEPAATLSATAALPFGERLLAVEPDGGVDVLSRTGQTETRLDATCPDARTPAVSDRGAVFACDDHALIVSETDGAFDAEPVPYPKSAADGPASGFGHRPGTPLLGAVTADGGGLVLDVAHRDWIELDLTQAVTVTGTGEEGPLLALTQDGRLHSFDTDGTRLGDKSILDSIDAKSPRPHIEVDTERAYLTGPGDDTLTEIDYVDDLRVARELAVDADPEFLVETGR